MNSGLRSWTTTLVAAGGLLVSAGLAQAASAQGRPDKQAIIATYADIAHAGYTDSVALARDLQKAVDTLIATPSAAQMAAARQAWLAARVPYMQTEVFRFGNAIVDDWEGKVNAWPLDEGLIDYVAPAYGNSSGDNPVYAANVIANPEIRVGGKTVDAAQLTKALLADSLHEIGGVEANVATGYHAIEFLLWGQDLNGTGPGAGNRPWTDYAKGDACTNGNCDRRAAYLDAATELLVDDLVWMAMQWAPKGAARQDLMAVPADQALARILTGLGSLSYGELAGERIKLGLMLHDPEEEHDCFSDNTHNSHYYDVIGMLNVYTGSYTRPDGSKLSGAALADLVAQKDPGLNERMLKDLRATEAAMAALKKRAETVEHYDQMIGAENAQGNATVQKVVDALTTQTRTIEKLVSTLDLQPIAFEGSDSLDNPEAVFQ